jgi:hypothetical protein
MWSPLWLHSRVADVSRARTSYRPMSVSFQGRPVPLPPGFCAAASVASTSWYHAYLSCPGQDRETNRPGQGQRRMF